MHVALIGGDVAPGILRDSSLDWVVARCPDMTSKPARGNVLALEDS
jgi:hypothetical protein